jgi:hypothetical protein
LFEGAYANGGAIKLCGQGASVAISGEKQCSELFMSYHRELAQVIPLGPSCLGVHEVVLQWHVYQGITQCDVETIKTHV